MLSQHVDAASMALQFEVLARSGRARASQLTLPHYECATPMFMPVGTQGSVKGLTSEQLAELDCHVILGNTYHLANRPGSDLIDRMGGLHHFINWKRGMLTDSGGFQMVSLLHLADITEEGVTFQSPVDGRPMLLTPEQSIRIQNEIGADIIMALDDVVSSLVTGPRIEEAMHRTLRWIDRCIEAHSRSNEQNLFGIIQGGLDPRLRDLCLKGMMERDKDLPGYAIGGLAGGEDKASFWRVVAQCTAALPDNKPRYVMTVETGLDGKLAEDFSLSPPSLGSAPMCARRYPLDIVVCSALGADMYDCVYPTRTARFGTALVPEGTLRLKLADMKHDMRPIDPTCACMVCQKYTRAYLHAVVTKEPIGAYLVSYHNVAYMMRLTRDIRTAITQQRFPQYVRDFLQCQFPKGDIPDWVRDALKVAGIDV
ncbi:Queuine tRNA-ribosyltransferase [Klebsormidium nitens]|uniref:Queuine tRNA-ribosyltransferase catalytic subunit 1 n=1 Tax=Klebsormidium nitens TaxID=105231 RepID=A0A1Y1ICU9_KLENI|nr:Queuine tRNA-ribosyltransferase [Klebsormidium nitens]|eukprot:GAQ88784.1 Queuine tRNA-ribosyltransferase [Klebsormidium nitens]